MSGTNQANLRSASWGGAVLAEVLSSVAEGDLVSQLLGSALARARLAEVPGHPARLAEFVQGALRHELSERIGASAADAVCDEMRRFTDAAPRGAIARGRPQPTLRVVVVSGEKTLADELTRILEGEALVARVATAADLETALEAAGARDALTVVVIDGASGVLPFSGRQAVAALMRHRSTTRSVVTRTPGGALDAAIGALTATGFRLTLVPDDAEAGEIAEACVALLVPDAGSASAR